jgi:hypothetical protein
MRDRIVVLFVMTLLTPSRMAAAQTYVAGADVYFYGDNTEFVNPFRAGETTLGISGRVFLDAALNDAVTIRGGLFGLGRFGAHDFLEHAEPAVALQVTRGSSRFVFGSLETIATRHDTSGPDEETPHRLLPPLQDERLSFSRGQEMGLQWLVASRRLDHDAWINWQRLNTTDHRERFDTGYRASVRLTSALRLHAQYHLVHEGGQHFQNGAVSDTQAGAAGLEGQVQLEAGSRVSVDAHVVATRDTPNREAAATKAGLGVFTRGAVQRGAWRVHVILWRGRDALKGEGDANYLAQRRDGSLFRKVRDYAEAGVTRHFRPAPQVHMFAAFRMHRVEHYYDYSYRIVARVRVRHNF